MILTIAARELRSLFLSPLAWAILAVTQFILAWLFLAQIDTWLTLQPRLAAIEGAPGVADIVVAPLLANAATVLLLITPLITMRSLSDEYRGRTISLLFSAPVSMTEIVLGNYLGILGFFLVVLIMLALMPLSLLVGTAASEPLSAMRQPAASVTSRRIPVCTSAAAVSVSSGERCTNAPGARDEKLALRTGISFSAAVLLTTMPRCVPSSLSGMRASSW